MDSMDVNKGVAAILVAGIAFFITGMIGDNLVSKTPPTKVEIKVGAPAATAAKGPSGPAPIAPLLAKADLAKGKAFVTQVCAACHSFNPGGKPIVGPNLYNIVGAPHDHEAGFAYSAALEKFKGQPWTYSALNHWLYKPSAYAPGTHMTFAGIQDNQLRADVIDYLHTLSPHPLPLPKVTAAAKAAAPAKTPAPGKPPAPGKTAAAGPSALDTRLADANIAKGKAFANQVCSACHSLNKGGKPIVGPNLWGVVGGPHDHEAGFAYSAALEKFKGKPWTFAALNQWLKDPAKYAPGTHMTFAGIPQPQLRADVIVYLDSLSDKPVPLPKAGGKK